MDLLQLQQYLTHMVLRSTHQVITQVFSLLILIILTRSLQLGNVYIGDFGNNRIRKVTVSTGIISTFAGTGTSGYSGDGGAATSAGLSLPVGVTLDTAGNLFISSLLLNI